MLSGNEAGKRRDAHLSGNGRPGLVIGDLPGIGPVSVEDRMALEKDGEGFRFLIGQGRARGEPADYPVAHELHGRQGFCGG